MKIMTLLFGVSLIFLLVFHGNKFVTYIILLYKTLLGSICLNVNVFFLTVNF